MVYCSTWGDTIWIPDSGTTTTSVTGSDYYKFHTILESTVTASFSVVPPSYSIIIDSMGNPINEPPAINLLSPEENARIEAEEQQAEQECQVQNNLERELRRSRKDAAKQKAEQLLIEHLTPAQRQQYQQHSYFFVTGQSGNRYRLRKERIQNIDVLDYNGNCVRYLCAHPEIACPDEDTLLVQKIMLEHNERAFLAEAQEWPVQ